ncbi:Dopa 4,5-dioxygenase family [Seminavis robusta]|uniref:Dopa 4,5-dioxygenase family n=1 Tax=Seminavis robusta TaxID=568900 RepID=A0A9N8H8D5_9STRA|nr:Dopa 4,5-dioxygenase family [Seminavis robusta]|eukprot:Sro166_g074050.1 Dopa 4,5-dioxygenase family (132) ;mRNA; f:13148-13543
MSAANNDNSLGYTLKERNPYDVHVYYSTPEQREQAMVLRDKLQKQFGEWMRFYEPKGKPIGPHPVPMWEADFGSYEHRRNLIQVRDFLEQQRGNLSILIHPHSTDTDYMDHTQHAIWLGEALDLKLEGWPR